MFPHRSHENGNSVKDTPQKSDSYMITNPGRRSTNHQVTMPVHGHTSPRRENFGLAVVTAAQAPSHRQQLDLRMRGHHAFGPVEYVDGMTPAAGHHARTDRCSTVQF